MSSASSAYRGFSRPIPNVQRLIDDCDSLLEAGKLDAAVKLLTDNGIDGFPLFASKAYKTTKSSLRQAIFSVLGSVIAARIAPAEQGWIPFLFLFRLVYVLSNPVGRMDIAARTHFTVFT